MDLDGKHSPHNELPADLAARQQREAQLKRLQELLPEYSKPSAQEQQRRTDSLRERLLRAMNSAMKNNA